MRETSDAYKRAMEAKERRTRIEGKITTEQAEYIFADADVIPGSLSVNRKCINNRSFEYGAAVTSEMNISLLLPGVDRYSMYDARIEISNYTRLPDGSEECIRIGVWNVYEPVRAKKIIALKCYDNMLLFDQDILEDTMGTPYELLNYGCQKCGVTMAQMEEELLELLINADCTLTVRSDQVNTYRDMLCYIGMVTCTHACIDEFGRLKMCRFSKIPVGEMAPERVLSSSVSDYVTCFDGVRARFIANDNYAPYESRNDTKPGIVLDMGDIPIVRGEPGQKKQLLDNIRNDILQIAYTPVDINITGDPALEPGDLITLKKANLTEEDVNILITSCTWNHHAAMKVTSSGSNPLLTGKKDRTQKQLSIMDSEISDKDIAIKTYTNARRLTLNSNGIGIISFNYAGNSGTTAILLACMPVKMSLDGNIVLEYWRDGVLVADATLVKYLERGDHFLTFSNYFAVGENERSTLTIKAYTEYCESDIRRQQADMAAVKEYINTGTYTEKTPDSTIPVADIVEYGIKAVLFGQGLAAGEQWDGTIIMLQEMEAMPLQSLELAEIWGQAETKDVQVKRETLKEQISMVLPGLAIADVQIAAVTEKGV